MEIEKRTSGSEYPERSNGGFEYPERSTAGGSEYPERSNGGSEYPETSTAGRSEYPERSTAGGSEYPETSTAGRSEYPERSTASGSEYPETSTAGRSEYPGTSTAGRSEYPGTSRSEYPGTSTAGRSEYPGTSTAGGSEYPETSIAGPSNGFYGDRPTDSEHNDNIDDPADPRICLICEDRATGLHYGIVSCEGCKGFFKRSICNKRVYRCNRDRNCAMSRKQRNRCQYCRLLKCLQMGMNRKAIREDGMPGGRNKSIGPVQITDEEIERIMLGQEFKEDAPELTWASNGDSDNSSPSNGASEGNQPSPSSTLSSSSTMSSNRSVEMNNYTAVLGDQYISTSISTHYQLLPHLFTYAAQSGLLAPQTHTLYPQSHPLVVQLMAAEDLAPLCTPMLVEDGYKVTQVELFALLCRLADELLFRQISWIKKLPFFCELSIEDYTCLLSSTWQELILLSCLTIYSSQIFIDLADVTDKYAPSNDELQSFSEDGIEVMERLIYMFRKFHQLKVSNEEYACMKAINFLNQDIRGLSNTDQLEQLNKRYWYVCQDYTECKYPHYPKRFPEIMMCLPEIRFIAGKMVNVPLEQLPLLFKAVLHSCKSSLTSSRTCPSPCMTNSSGN